MPIHNHESHNMCMNHSWTKIRLHTIQYMFVSGSCLIVWFPQHDQLASRTAFKALAAGRRTKTRGNCLNSDWHQQRRNIYKLHESSKAWWKTMAKHCLRCVFNVQGALGRTTSEEFRIWRIPPLRRFQICWPAPFFPVRTANSFSLALALGPRIWEVPSVPWWIFGWCRWDVCIVLLLPTILLMPQSIKCPTGKRCAFTAWSWSFHVSYVIKCLMYFQGPSLASSIGHRAHRHEARIGTGPGRFKTWPWNSQSLCKQPPHIRVCLCAPLI